MQIRTTENLPPYDGRPLERTRIIDDDLRIKLLTEHHCKIINPGFIYDTAARMCVKYRYQPELYCFWKNVFYRAEFLSEVTA